jgi:hypothetical protein
MAEPVEKAALRLARNLRSGKHSRGIVALLVCIVLGQSLLVIHRVDHASVGHQVSCALCLAADHQAGGVAQAQAPSLSRSFERVAFIDGPSTSVELALAYQSRAPPRV